MEKSLTDCRIIGFRRSNIGRTSNVYMIRECNYCHAILEFPNDQVSTKIDDMKSYQEYILCPNCCNKVIVLEDK